MQSRNRDENYISLRLGNMLSRIDAFCFQQVKLSVLGHLVKLKQRNIGLYIYVHMYVCENYWWHFLCLILMQ